MTQRLVNLLTYLLAYLLTYLMDETEVEEYAVRTRSARVADVNNLQTSPFSPETEMKLDRVKIRNRRNKTSKSTITKYFTCS